MMDLQHDPAAADIVASVNERYGNYAIDAASDGFRHDTQAEIAMAFGYTQEELKGIPDRANLGLSCGNPVALASLKEVSFKNVRTAPSDNKASGRSDCRLW